MAFYSSVVNVRRIVRVNWYHHHTVYTHIVSVMESTEGERNDEPKCSLFTM